MTYLRRLIADHICELGGAEFKLAAYLYDRLEQEEQISEEIETFARATGVSWRQTQTALRSLAQKGILEVDSTPRRGTSCRLPQAVKTKRAYRRRRPHPVTATEVQVKPSPPVVKSVPPPAPTASPSQPKPALSSNEREISERIRDCKNRRLTLRRQ